ncbi:MAG: hypothetical protein Q9220_006458 [cf. Caloplaca sp. 1 TL-2023]
MPITPNSSVEDPLRTARLLKLFQAVNKGERNLSNSQDGSRYIEAICSQPDPAECINTLVSSLAGLKALQKSISFDVSDAFLNGQASTFLRYLQDSALENLLGGIILRQILESITEPSFFWHALLQAYNKGNLQPMAQKSFGWILVQLMSSPDPQCHPYLHIARSGVQDSFLHSDDVALRAFGSRMRHILSVSGPTKSEVSGVGTDGWGRHDNDFADFREIAILPTADELTSKESPFLQYAEAIEDPDKIEQRLAMHLENQFRLYREDMLGELREEILVALGQKKGRHRGIIIDGLKVLGVSCGTDVKSQSWGIRLQCHRDLPHFHGVKPKDRKQVVESSQNLLRHQSLVCLILDGEVTAFPYIHRDVDSLAAVPSIIDVKFTGSASASIAKTMLKLKSSHIIKLVQVDTAIFSYEPILSGLQRMKTLPLAEELLFWSDGGPIPQPPRVPETIIKYLERHPQDDLQAIVQSSKSIVLDAPQRLSLIASLKQSVCLIQGPPGTGKSFIGALTAKILHEFTLKTILVVCYTNHALDQFLEDLLDIGIPECSMLRLGSMAKTSARLKSMGLQEQASRLKLSPHTFGAIQQLKLTTNHLATRLEHNFNQYMRKKVSSSDIIGFLEFSSADLDYSGAFTVPQANDGATVVGKRGRSIAPWYLLDRWYRGHDRGVFSHLHMSAEIRKVWQIPGDERLRLVNAWSAAILEEQVAEFSKIADQYEKAQHQLDKAFKSKNVEVIQSKRVIGCTTTAAAKYAHELRAAARDVLLVEEAGEILESHVLTALGGKTTQLILIGDHKQLRPKIANYDLSVEKNEGYDLNRSLFERLILKGFPHHVLAQQHRMRPEISSLVRSLTYPDLLDAPKTKGRPNLLGFQDNLIFVDHRQLEDDIQEQVNWKEMTSVSSKQNVFEAHMVVRCVRYLAQQGYNTDDIVVLTPYLGQLRLLQQMLSQDNDTVLHDLDVADLLRAGLMPSSHGKQSRSKIRLACIDNYQGEESKIVIASLTRSNKKCDIGFMSAPERLNVLLSRARNAMIIIGNSETFKGSRKGSNVWTQLFNILEASGHAYPGQKILTPNALMEDARTHEAEKKRERELKLQEKRDREAAEHARQLAEIEAQLQAKQQENADAQLSEERARAIQQKKADLAIATSLAIRSKPSSPALKSDRPSQDQTRSQTDEVKDPIATQASKSSLPVSSRAMNMEFTSVARDEWQQEKRVENAKNPALDELMDLVGLEDVKAQVLRIKVKIDAAKRQNSDVRKERFNAVFLGNPGTGKTTVARLYARILTSLEVLPGVAFIETSGSRLAHGGVGEAKKHIEDLLKAGGGAMFLDEAYQLTQGHSPSGRQVLDFLLPEMENNIGKIVFIFAGYDREMESFFEHNPGLPDRIPYRLKFADYNDSEFLWFLQQQIQKKWRGRMTVEDGQDGLYSRIAVRRVGRGRGRPGFSNARALEVAFAKISERQADRLNRDRKQGRLPDDFHLSKADVIGPEPSFDKILKSDAWQKVQALTGLKAVKESLQVMVDRIVTNYQRELKEKEPIEVSLNRVFLGNPGTGKTSVAKLYGRVLADLGLLSNGEVIVKNPTDFVGQYLGQSENQTKAILASAVGKVLIIDEAYALYAGDEGGNRSDSFKTGVIDTIVAEVQSVPGENRSILLLGYRDKMETMFRNVNPGLSRRIEDAFQFDDFSEPELRQILDRKMKQQDLDVTNESSRTVAMEVLNRARIRPHFGNAGEVDNLLSSAKDRFQKRQNALPISERSHDFIFESQDFDPEFDRVKHADEKLKKLFEDTVGCEDIVTKLAGYQRTVRGMKTHNIDARGQIPMNFLFKGPPGTGKTTTARKMGQVYYDMGFLSNAEVYECSASNLVGQYVGHTGPKTIAQLDKALGKVLFIDEAYRLATGTFATEAVNELVDQLTKPQYLNKVVVILAGYDKDINDLISINPGLSSRFPEEIIFSDMPAQQCVELLQKKLNQKKVTIAGLLDTASSVHQTMCDLFRQLATLPSFGNGREVETLAKTMVSFVYERSAQQATLSLSEEDAIRLTKTMLRERQVRSANVPNTSIEILPQATDPAAPAPFQPSWASSTTAPPAANDQKDNGKSPPPSTSADEESTDDVEESPDLRNSSPNIEFPADRDPGVSDEIWNQLQADKQAYEDQQQAEAAKIREQEDALRKNEEYERKRKMLLDKAARDDEEMRKELQRRHEAAKRRAQLAKEQLEKAKLEQIRKQEQEKKVQKKLREMGVCVQGFQWLRRPGGWRCAGGSHFVGDDQMKT